MMKMLTPAPLLLCLASVAAAVATSPEMVMKGNDHEKIGKAVADYWAAQIEAKDIGKTYEELEDVLDKQQKRFAKELRDGDILSAVEDWEEILYYARDSDEKGVKKGKVEDRVFADERFGEYTLAISTPKKYSAKTGPYPLVICIPPKGKKAEAHLLEDWADPSSLAARDEYVLAACDMPTNERTWSTFGTKENHGGLDTVMVALRTLRITHAIDVNRTYVAGFGEGVAVAADIAATFPHLFAGVVGRAGDLGDLGPANFRNLPTFFAGGGERCTTFQTRAKEMGFENVTVSAGAGEADIWPWLAGHPRDANPLEVSLAPRSAINSQAYWLKVDRFEPEAAPHITAKIDAAENTIHVKSEGIGEVTLFFNDLLVDLSKPVKVVCNGIEHEDKFPRRLLQLLDLVSKSGDIGRVYVTLHHYDLTEIR